MNKRQLQKKQTRELILNAAKTEFIRNGFLHTTTSQIASAAGIAHGTLFLHFKTKEALIVEILDQTLEGISKEIQTLISQSAGLGEMLSHYLELISQQEDLFTVLARELPFYSEELRRKILFRDSIIRSHFHQVITEGIEAGKYQSVSIASAITFLFGTINYYLSLKPVFIKEGSVIEKFKHSILDTFSKILAVQTGGVNEE